MLSVRGTRCEVAYQVKVVYFPGRTTQIENFPTFERAERFAAMAAANFAGDKAVAEIWQTENGTPQTLLAERRSN